MTLEEMTKKERERQEKKLRKQLDKQQKVGSQHDSTTHTHTHNTTQHETTQLDKQQKVGSQHDSTTQHNTHTQHNTSQLDKQQKVLSSDRGPKHRKFSCIFCFHDHWKGANILCQIKVPKKNTYSRNHNVPLIHTSTEVYVTLKFELDANVIITSEAGAERNPCGRRHIEA